MRCLTRKLLISENVPYTLVQNLVARFAETEPGEEVLVQSLVEIISEIKEPMVVQEIPQNPDSIMKRKLEVRCYIQDINFQLSCMSVNHHKNYQTGKSTSFALQKCFCCLSMIARRAGNFMKKC